MTKPKKAPGPTLCSGHAHQAQSGIDLAATHCLPDPTWLGGSGQVVTCDVIANPSRADEYLARCRAAITRREARQAAYASALAAAET